MSVWDRAPTSPRPTPNTSGILGQSPTAHGPVLPGGDPDQGRQPCGVAGRMAGWEAPRPVCRSPPKAISMPTVLRGNGLLGHELPQRTGGRYTSGCMLQLMDGELDEATTKSCAGVAIRERFSR